MSKAPDTHASSTAGLLQPSELTKDNLQQLIAATEKGGFKIVRWHNIGRPAVDKVVATFNGPAEKAGLMVDTLFRATGVHPRIVDGFPNGVPRFETVSFNVELTAGG